MILEAPFLALLVAVFLAGDRSVLLLTFVLLVGVNEKHGEHFRALADSKELRVIAELRVIVRGWRRGPRKLVRDRLERFDERRSELGVVVLQDARFVEHNARPRFVLKQVEPIVIRDDDGR